MENRLLKDRIYNILAIVSGAMANSRRMEIIDILSQGTFSVEDIATHANLSIANASKHLQILKNARLVSSEKEGNYVYYKLNNCRVLDAWSAMRDLAVELHSEICKLVKDYKKKDATLIPMTLDELIYEIETNEAVLLNIDLDDNTEDLEGELTISLDRLRKHISVLSVEQQIIAYRRERLCILTDETVEQLNESGFKVKKLVKDIPEWMMKKCLDGKIFP